MSTAKDDRVTSVEPGCTCGGMAACPQCQERDAATAENDAAPNVEYGDPNVARPNTILRTTVGSGVHGIAIAGTDDHDEMGVYVPPPEHLLGTRNVRDDYVFRTQPEGARSGPGDVDLILYSLRKYLRLAVKGNPTALLPLYAPLGDVLESTDLGQQLRAMRTDFLSQQAVRRFLGYMQAQHERMLGGGKRNRVPNRPELIERFGFDTKYASHALRLAYQGFEICESGTLTLPLRDQERERVLAVKRGEVPQAEVSAEITSLSEGARRLLDNGKAAVPERPNYARINRWSVHAHLAHWHVFPPEMSAEKNDE